MYLEPCADEQKSRGWARLCTVERLHENAARLTWLAVSFSETNGSASEG